MISRLLPRGSWSSGPLVIMMVAKPAAAPQLVPAAQTSATKISVISTPAGADIEVDGGFVGNTPSVIEVASGEHAITVSKNGYKSWERKLKANGGNVNLNVELEAQAK